MWCGNGSLFVIYWQWRIQVSGQRADKRFLRQTNCWPTQFLDPPRHRPTGQLTVLVLIASSEWHRSGRDIKKNENTDHLVCTRITRTHWPQQVLIYTHIHELSMEYSRWIFSVQSRRADCITTSRQTGHVPVWKQTIQTLYDSTVSVNLVK